MSRNMKWVCYGLREIASKSRRECMDSCGIGHFGKARSLRRDRTARTLGRYVATELGSSPKDTHTCFCGGLDINFVVTVFDPTAELFGLPAPYFDDEPQVPKRDGAPEPADGLKTLNQAFVPLLFCQTEPWPCCGFMLFRLDLGRVGSGCYDRQRTHGSWVLRFLGTLGPCNDQTSWISYDWISFGDPGGPHSATLGEATLGTCWGIAFYSSEAGHYQVPVLHAAFCRKPKCQALLLSTSGEVEYYVMLPDFFTCSREIIPRVPCDPQGLTYFWDERPCWRVPPSSAGLYLFLGSRDRGRDSFHAPDLIVRGPLSLVDEGFQHFPETCSHIHPPERPGSEASCLAKCLHPAFGRPLLRIRLASRCDFEGLRGRPCRAVDIGSLMIPRVLGMIQGPPSPE
ncbi:hypothetical protein F2Q69_00031265 [Brassica cretica]|uniref:Uncharacterized protein n=1 Tax=Brassica cretica TaxID=69181 RepID=A0A8S9S2G6_BRACR|nr:hypothetical protein F2Q69_00031265 [Brassica cretica]